MILRPGLVVGDKQESGPAEGVFRSLAKTLGGLGNGFKDLAQDAVVIARAAVTAGLQGKKGVTVLEQADIVRLGRTEWKS